MQERKLPKKYSFSILSIAGVRPYKEKLGEEYMNKKQIVHFHRILESWRKKLIYEIERTVTHMQENAKNFPDPIDRATQEEEFSFELSNRSREHKIMKNIAKTMKKIEEERNFGYCESCGIEIGIRRLEASPTTELCIDCKKLYEIRENKRKI